MGKSQRREMMAMEGTITNLNYVPYGYHDPYLLSGKREAVEKKDNEVGAKIAGVIDDILIQERLEVAQKKRDARNAKRLKNWRK